MDSTQSSFSAPMIGAHVQRSEQRMDQEFIEHLIKRHTEPLERRLRDLEATVQERMRPLCVEEAELSLVTSESDDEPTCVELVLGKKRMPKSTLCLQQHGSYEKPQDEMLPLSPSAAAALSAGERLVEPQPIDADVFGMTLVSLVECLGETENGDHAQGDHYAQFGLSLFLLFLSFSLQIGLLYETKHLVTPHPVRSIRDVYDQFEIVMYGNNIDTMELTPNGKHRGYPEYFQPELFNTLSPELQSKACRIPFSQPLFFFVVCFVWSSQCVAEIKRLTIRARCLICNTRTSRSMKTRFRGTYPASERVIQELTISTKVLITMLLLLPRFLITFFLLWLGCRWLAATDSFAGLIWNVVALEFVLSIKFLVYEALSPLRASFAVEHTKMLPVSDKVENGYGQLYGTLVWTSLALAWVWCYMHYFQSVLPDYRWDVHAVCTTWINANILAG